MMDAITQTLILDVRALALELVARGDMLGGIAAMSIVDRAEQALLADLDGHQTLTLAEWQAIPHHMIGGFDGVVFMTLAGPDCDKCACPAAQHDPESGECDSYRSEDDGGTEANGYTCPCPGYTPRPAGGWDLVP